MAQALRKTHGVENAQVVHKKPSAQPPTSRIQSRTDSTQNGSVVTDDFSRNKSLQARTIDRRFDPKVRNDADQLEDERAPLQQTITRAGAKGARRSRSTYKKVRKVFKRVRGTAALVNPFAWTIVIGICFWQFAFGVAALAGYGADVLVTGAITDSLLGQAVSYFVDIGAYIPLEYVGHAFWAIATLSAICGYFCFSLWYLLTGLNPFGTFASAGITVILFILDIMPIFQIFPWMILWVLFIGVNAVFLKS